MSPSPDAPTTAPPGVEQAVALGLTRDEYALVVEELGGREPNEVELAMFSLLWSEHCAYKHSKKLLRTLPTEGPAVVMGPGENAGAVAPEQVVLRYAEGHNFNGSQDDIAGVVNAQGNVMGLMPHPEHAVDLLTGGSADGLRLFEGMARVAVA